MAELRLRLFVAVLGACSASSSGWAAPHQGYQFDAPQRGYTYEYTVPLMPQRLLPPPPPLLAVTPVPSRGPYVTKTVFVMVERPGDEQELFNDLPALLELIEQGPGPGPAMQTQGPWPWAHAAVPPSAFGPGSGSSVASEQPAFMFSGVPYWPNPESSGSAWRPHPSGGQGVPDVKEVAPATPAVNSDALEYENDAADAVKTPNSDGGGLIDIRSGRSIAIHSL